MIKFKLFISIVIIALSSTCYSFFLDGGAGRRVTDCMFGPFQGTVKKCMSRGWRFTGCLLEGLNWFRKDGSLNLRVILESFTRHVKNERFMQKVKAIVKKCTKTANSNETFHNEIADSFVKCLNRDNAFADLFPKAFCEEDKDKDEEFIASAVVIPPVHNESKVEREEPRNLTNCGLGPFKINSMHCSLMGRGYDHCLLYHLDLFTEDGKIDMTKLLSFIGPYMVNSVHIEQIYKIIDKCVGEANTSNRGKRSVSNELVKCWHRENAFSIFQAAFCTETKKQNLAIRRAIPLTRLHRND